MSGDHGDFVLIHPIDNKILKSLMHIYLLIYFIYVSLWYIGTFRDSLHL